MPASIRPAPRALCSSLAKANPVPRRAERGRTARLCAGSAELLFVHRASRAQADMPTRHAALARVSSATLATLAGRAPAPASTRLEPTRPASSRLDPPPRDPPPRRLNRTTCSALMQQAAAMAEAPPWSCVSDPQGSRQCGAVEKTRTSTAFRPQRPQRCASTIPPRPHS